MVKKFWKVFLLAALMALPLRVSEASVEEHKTSAQNCKMSYPIVYVDNNQAAQDKINSDLYQYIAGFQNDYKAGKFFKGDFSYNVRYEDDKVVSLTLADFRYKEGAAHGYTYTRGLSYDKATGERLPLYYYAKIRPEDKALILRQPIFDGSGKHVRRDKTFASSRSGFNETKITDNYYMAGNGELVLIYPPYELGPYYLGTLYVHLSQDIVDYLNRKNQ
ncbi:MAG: DUF3298 and DUF4163 domain-containing protein [Acidaminococcus sp.]|jgi:hypothetical protein|nr:DUF3298 and DUF4163 domain-containing protein [Acidaminococcus sp.]MCI2114438.1 DUF3298 and DUF4163 domain-containing protein [Acidaminococcus sp.]MCI2116173.1 DUF3298 and DUF4163 domain-containing protein [Acidaminococcus sp.]